MRLISQILTLIIAICVVWFAIANRHPVDLTLDPFPLSFSAPLYLPVLIAALVGMIAGGVISWRSGGGRRARLRRAERQRDALRRDLDRLEAKTPSAGGVMRRDEPREP